MLLKRAVVTIDVNYVSPTLEAVLWLSGLSWKGPVAVSDTLARAADHLVTPKRTDARYARLLCSHCREYGKDKSAGVRYLSKLEYDTQLYRPVWYWSCPVCGLESYFDDDYFSRPARQPSTLPMDTCDQHVDCAIDPCNGDHVDTNTGERSKPECDHEWIEQEGEPPRDVCFHCGEERF